MCNKLLSCGHHRCTRTCHDGPCSECLLLPENCKTCACGKTTMDNAYRTSCIDPVRSLDRKKDFVTVCFVFSCLCVRKFAIKHCHVVQIMIIIDVQHRVIMIDVQRVIKNQYLFVVVDN